MITLDEYIVQLKNDVEDFEKYWNARSKGNPKHFPSQMYLADWDEQFMIFHEDILQYDEDS